ncbi:MAG: sugar phosphate nucleotidyltransferase, partial [Candidatus Aenigmatarchaeota archaeon]
MTVNKAVIPAAGLGTRLFPATKAQPKEMLIVGKKPVIHYVVEEALEAGIQDILIVTGKHKRAIEDYFDSYHSKDHLRRNGKEDRMKKVEEIENLDCNIHYKRQMEPKG